MGTAEPHRILSIEEYLELESQSEVRHEFYHGEIFAMSGGSGNHATIIGNLHREIGSRGFDQGCRTLDSSVKVKIENEEAIVYPDLSILCGKAQYTDEKNLVLENPLIVIEVLSPSTELYDRVGKFEKYRKISSLVEYILVSQEAPKIEIHRKVDQEWKTIDRYDGLETSIRLNALDIEIPMERIYAFVQFPEGNDTLRPVSS